MGREDDVSQDARSGVPADRVAPYERLERFGKASWWALGAVLLIGLAFYLLQRFGSFILPSLVGIVLATTLSPVVGWLERHRVPRLLGAIIVSLLIVLVLVAIAWAAVVIVVDQSSQIWHTLTEASSRIDRWLGGSGTTVDTLAKLQKVIAGLRSGAAGGVLPLALRGVRQLYDLVVAVFLAGGFSFFFLWEGPLVRRWISGHLSLPRDVGLRITGSLVQTTRRYVAGLSAIGAMEAVIVGATAGIAGEAAWPLIAVTIFVGNYIPYIGGLVAGVFAVLLTLGDLGVGPGDRRAHRHRRRVLRRLAHRRVLHRRGAASAGHGRLRAHDGGRRGGRAVRRRRGGAAGPARHRRPRHHPGAPHRRGCRSRGAVR